MKPFGDQQIVWDPGWATIEMDVTAEITNGADIVHERLIAALIDTAA